MINRKHNKTIINRLMHANAGLVGFVVLLCLLLFRGLILEPLLLRYGEVTSGYVYSKSFHRHGVDSHFYFTVNGKDYYSCRSIDTGSTIVDVPGVIDVRYMAVCPRIHCVSLSTYKEHEEETTK